MAEAIAKPKKYKENEEPQNLGCDAQRKKSGMLVQYNIGNNVTLRIIVWAVLFVEYLLNVHL